MVSKLLQNIIQHAYKTVPYYKSMFDEYGIDPLSIKTQDDLMRLPLLTKEQIQEDPDSFISSDYLYFPKNSDLVIRRTSGSTGKFMKIYWSKQDDIRSMFHLWQVRRKIYDINPSSKFCSFHTTIYNNNKLTEAPDILLLRAGRNLSFNKLNMNMKRIAEYYDKIMEFKPEWFLIQPSLAFLLAEYISENHLQTPQTLKYIELTGEYLIDDYRKKIKEVFKTKVVNQYGCNEANSIAIECPNGSLHCLSNNVIVKVLKDKMSIEDGAHGEISITCFTNFAMPFIRYALGDHVKLIKGDCCSCGNKNPVIEVLSGRISEYVLLENGEKLNCYIFLYPVETINSQMGGPIAQFQIIQNSINRFTAYFALKKSFVGWKDTISCEFKEACCKVGLKNIEWDFIFVNQILPSPSTGKLQFFKNSICNEGSNIYA